jgi:hypothetical protein
MLDYLIGIALIAAPWLFDFADNETARWVTIALGAGVVLYSLLTDYELGVVKAIPMSIHLGLDIVAGLVLAVSPWVFDFSETVWVPHVVVGIVEIVSALMTHTVPERMRRIERTDVGQRRAV